MIRAALLTGVILASMVGHAHASGTYRCTGTNADLAGMNATLAAGGFVYWPGNLAHCHITGTLIGNVAGTVLYGDGAAYVPAPDATGRARQTAYGLAGTALKIVPSTGPSTTVEADVTAERASPFTLLAVTAQPFYVEGISFVGNYDQIATLNTPGSVMRGVTCLTAGTTFNGDGTLASLGGLTLDHVEFRAIGSSSFYFAGGNDCGATNSVSQTTWGSAAYAGKSNGTYLIGDVFANSSLAATYGSSFTYYDQVGLDVNHAKAVISQSTDLGGDRLHDSSVNNGTAGGPDYDFQNYTDNTSTTPTCYTMGLVGTPVVGQTFVVTATLSRPVGAAPGSLVYIYVTTLADTLTADPLYSVMTNIAALMNTSPLAVGGVSMQTYAWQAGHAQTFTHALEWRLPGDLSCIARVTIADSGPTPLTQNPGTNGNGSGGGATHNGNSGPAFDVQNYVYQSRNYGDAAGGATVNVHIVDNVIDGFTNGGIHGGTGINDGSPDGGQNGLYVLDNQFPSPNNACGAIGCANPLDFAIYVTVSAKCGSWTFTGHPQLGETLVMTQSAPGASNSGQTYTYHVTALDIAAVGPIVSLADNFATAYNAGTLGGTPLSIGGNTMAALEQSSNQRQPNPGVQFSLKVPGVCTQTMSYTDSVSPGGVNNINIVSHTGVVGASVLGGIVAGNRGGSVQSYPPNSAEFWADGNMPSSTYP